MYFYARLFIVLAVSSCVVLGKLSDYVEICKYGDPNINECVRSSAQKMFQEATKGIREYKIPPIDPLPVPMLLIDQGVGPVGLVLTFTDAKIHGIKGAVVTSVRVDPDNYYLEGNLTGPALHIEGDYEIQGKILLLPITGKGKCNISFEDVDILVRIHGKPVTKKGKTYMQIEKFIFHIFPKGGGIYLGNLFNGNKQLSDTMNNFLNSNFIEVIGELKPSINDALSQLFGGLAKRVFDKVPYTEMYPKS